MINRSYERCRLYRCIQKHPNHKTQCDGHCYDLENHTKKDGYQITKEFSIAHRKRPKKCGLTALVVSRQ